MRFVRTAKLCLVSYGEIIRSKEQDEADNSGRMVSKNRIKGWR
jgi:hypothetical protein